jgi:hypothetical protein
MNRNRTIMNNQTTQSRAMGRELSGASGFQIPMENIPPASGSVDGQSMPFNRRNFLRLAASTIATGVLASSNLGLAAPTQRIKAIVFDAFPIFDPRSVFALAERLFPARGLS